VEFNRFNLYLLSPLTWRQLIQGKLLANLIMASTFAIISVIFIASVLGLTFPLTVAAAVIVLVIQALYLTILAGALVITVERDRYTRYDNSFEALLMEQVPFKRGRR